MGNCCCQDENTPTVSLRDCVKNIRCQSACLSNCCLKDSKADGKPENTAHEKKHHHHKHKHKHDNHVSS